VVAAAADVAAARNISEIPLQPELA